MVSQFPAIGPESRLAKNKLVLNLLYFYFMRFPLLLLPVTSLIIIKMSPLHISLFSHCLRLSRGVMCPYKLPDLRSPLVEACFLLTALRNLLNDASSSARSAQTAWGCCSREKATPIRTGGKDNFENHLVLHIHPHAVSRPRCSPQSLSEGALPGGQRQ